MTRPPFTYPPKPAPGDRIAVLSPSVGLPELFPEPFELGLRRLRQDFELEPVEYPTTRDMSATPERRAADVHAAFDDPEIKAVVASIGGEEELRLLAHLDTDLLAENPKPFFGYSDNTNLLHLLWNLGIVAYHGGAVMVQWGRPGRMHPTTSGSLHRALFTRGPYELEAPSAFTDEERDWADPDALTRPPDMQPVSPWRWHGARDPIEGTTWGGNLEVVDEQLRTGTYLQPDDAYDDTILLLETSEEMPDATYVSRLLMCMGERGLLPRFSALLLARPKAWSRDNPLDADAKDRYSRTQRDTVLEAMAHYNPDAVVVTDVDFGHTDPQLVIPHGGHLKLDPQHQRITVTY